MTVRTQMIFYLLLGTLLVAASPEVQAAPGWWSALFGPARNELAADQAFIKGRYDKAMQIYERVYKHLPPADGHKDRLALKMARLYMLLQQPGEAIRYYGTVYERVDTLMSVNDVCFFIDALRGNDQRQTAEVVARHYAFTRPYNRNQRYLNTLHSIANQQYYYQRGDADYSVERLESNSSLAEYWIGEWEGVPFYAVSMSQMQDPRKICYHHTQFYSLRDNAVKVFKDIPRELQSGPLALSPDGKMMVSTRVTYRSNDRIMGPEDDEGMFVDRLFYSRFDPKRGGWSNFAPLFPVQEGVSYAHPVFFNDGKSLLFASDRPGGFGGMDLYMCHWDETSQAWEGMINLGPEVNTEGDEIYPRIIGNALFFSSNGQEGYGGYDVYRISFGKNIVMPGTLYHYPYPVNTVANDFGIFFDGEKGYFISDRDGASGRDDIYTFNAARTPLSSKAAIGVSEEYSAMVGNLNLIKGLGGSNQSTLEKEIEETLVYVLPENGELLTSIYFDFNSYVLTPQSQVRLLQVMAMRGFEDIEEISVVGYADELGPEGYNQWLSGKRAQVTVRFLKDKGAKVKFFPEGRGQLHIPLDDYVVPSDTLSLQNAEVQGTRMPLTRKEKIDAYQKARRVDIIVKKK